MCACTFSWEAHPPSPQGERCPLDVATCAAQSINTHRTSQVNTMGSAPCLLPCRFEIFPGILKHFPGAHTHLYSMIEEVKDFITENMERHQKMLDPSGPKDFIPSCFTWTRQDLRRICVGDGKQSDGNCTDIELISLGAMYVFFKR